MATQAELQVLLKAKDEASSVIKGVRNELGQFVKTSNSASSAAVSSADATRKSTSAFSALGKAATTALAVVGGFAVFSKLTGAISDAAGAAIGFEKSMSNIKAVSGATGQQMQQMSALALQLGKDTSFSASQAASGIEELLKGGVSIGDIFGGAASAALDLAAAGGISVGEAATIASNALNQFSLRGTDMAHVADLVAGAANASSISVSDFNQSLASGGAVAAAAGQSIDAFAIAVALMGAAGIKGSDAGTSLKAMFNTLIPTTKEATNKMRELGIITADGKNQFIDATGAFKDFGAISEILQTQTAGLTESQKLLALETIFGTDGMRAALIAAKAGGEGYDEMGRKILASGGAAAVAREKLNNLSGDIETFKGSVETAGIIIASEFLPALRGIAQGATAAVNTFIQEASTLIVTAHNIAGASGLGLIPAALTAIELRIGEVFGSSAQTIFHSMVDIVKGVGNAFGAAKEALSPFSDAFGTWVHQHLQGSDVTTQRLADALNNLAPAIKENEGAVRGLAAAFAVILGANAIGGFLKALAALGTALGVFAAGVATVFGVVTVVIAVWAAAYAADIGKVRAVTDFLIAGILGMPAFIGDAFARNTVAIAAFAAEAGFHFKNFQATVTNVLDDIAGSSLGQAIAIGVNIVNGIVQALNPASLITAVVTMVAEAIAGASATAAAQAPAVGSNIISGIVSGITGGIPRVLAAAANMAQAAIAAAMGHLKEGSPSKVFEEIGENVDLGFIAGIDGMTADVETAIGDLMTGAGEAAVQSSEEAFANLGTLMGAQFEKTYTIVEAAQQKGLQALEDAEGLFQRAQDKEERQFQRRLQDLREEAGRATVKERKDVLQKIEQLQEDHGRKILDMAAAQEDKLFDLELDAADNVRKAQEQQNLARGAALRDFQRGTDELLRDTTNKAIEIGKKAATAIKEAMADAGKSIQEAKDKADEAIQALQDNQAASRDLRGVRDTFSAGQDAESKKRDRDQEDADLEFNLKKDLEKAKLKLGKDRGKAETDQDRRQLDIQYADEVQNLRDSFDEAKRDLARRRAIADDNDAFRKNQQRALQAFNDALEDDALKKQITRLQAERDIRIKELQGALDTKLTQINKSEADERAALAKSAAEKLDDLKTKFYDKVGQLNSESKSAFESLFETIANGVKAAAGAVNDLSAAINKVATMQTPNAPASGGGGMAAGDGQTFGGQTPDVQQMFLSAYGSRAAAEEAWVAEHNYELDLGNLGKAPKVVNGVDMGPYNGEAGQSWYSTPEESGSNAGDHFAGGGVVSGARGAARLVTAHGGEGVFTPEQMAAIGGIGGAGDIYLTMEIDGQRFAYATAPYTSGQQDQLIRLRLG